MGCLKEWLERSDSCPLCRRKVFGPNNAGARAQHRAEEQQDANAQPQPEDQPRQEDPIPQQQPQPQPEPEHRAELPQPTPTTTMPTTRHNYNLASPGSDNDTASIIATVDRQTEILRNSAVSHVAPIEGSSRDVEPTSAVPAQTSTTMASSTSTSAATTNRSSELLYQTINLPSSAVIPPDWVLLPLEQTEEENVDYKVSLSTELKANLRILEKGGNRDLKFYDIPSDD